MEFDGCHGTLSSVETHLGQWHVAEQRGGRGKGRCGGGGGLTRCFSCELSALSSLIGPPANLRHVSLSFRDDQTSLQSFNFCSYLCLSYGYDTAFSVEEAPQTAFACWPVFAKKNNNTEREWKIMIIKKKNAHHSRNATFRPHY